MKKWWPIVILGCAQFVMVLDSTVMNVSISTVVKDLNTSVTAMQAAITFYTLTMAAFMLLGSKLGDVWGRRRALVIGSIVYGLGSLTTGLSQSFGMLFTGWSIIEGLGAVLVIPAIAALVADNYSGKDRVTAFAIIGAISGGAVAAGPLIGGYFTTYLSWRYVFIAETVIMLFVLIFARVVADSSKPAKIRIDLLSVVLSAAGLVLIVYGMLQSKVWGWVLPTAPLVIGDRTIAPLGLSPVPYLIAIGIVLVWLFLRRQRALAASGRPALLDVTMFSIAQLRSGLAVLGAQYAVLAGLFFMIPVYLQMTLGMDALQTGIKIFPLSIGLILFSIVGTVFTRFWSPRRVVRIGQLVLVASALVLLSSVYPDLRSGVFAFGMFFAGSGLGLLASQLGNVNMSSVDESRSSEAGGLQGVFQNLGSSLGTALIGSILIATLGSTFTVAVGESNLSAESKSVVLEATEFGVAIMPTAGVPEVAAEAGLSEAEGKELQAIYSQAQLDSLRTSLFALAVIAAFALFFSRNIPNVVLGRSEKKKEPTA